MSLAPEAALEKLVHWAENRTLVVAHFAAAGGGHGCTVEGYVRIIPTTRFVIRSATASLGCMIEGATFEYGPLRVFPVPLNIDCYVEALQITWAKRGHWLFVTDAAGEARKLLE